MDIGERIVEQYYTAAVIDGGDDGLQAFGAIGYPKVMEHSYLTDGFIVLERRRT